MRELPAARAANGLPLGLQLSARSGADEELLAWRKRSNRYWPAKTPRSRKRPSSSAGAPTPSSPSPRACPERSRRGRGAGGEVPAARAASGLPLGLQLSARFGADEELLAWAQALEPLLAG